MDPWTLGLAVLLIVGLALVVYGALHDRARRRRAIEEMQSPPPRTIPRFSPEAPAPHYLSELQARRTRTDVKPTDLSDEDRSALRDQLERPSTVRLPVGYASRDFVTDHPSSWAVLDEPAVLVCAEPVLAVRELLSLLEKLVLANRPLVVVAPAFAAEVLATLEVNVIQRSVVLVAVAAPSVDDRRRASEATGAEPVSHSDLQAGYLAPDALGTCGRWVSAATTSFVLATTAP